MMLYTLSLARKTKGKSKYKIANDNFFTQILGSKHKNIVLFLLKENDGYSEQLRTMVSMSDKWLKKTNEKYKVYFYYC